MQLLYFDDKLYADAVGRKNRNVISERDIKAILLALGFDCSSVFKLSDYQCDDFDEKLGNGFSFWCDDSNNKFRIGKYTNGEVEWVKVSTDTIDELYSVQRLEGEINLALKGYCLKFIDGLRISKVLGCNDCVYEVRYNDYLFSCSFELDDESSRLLKEFEVFLLEYLSKLKFPLSDTIIDVYKKICEITGIPPKLQVSKNNVVTDMIDISLESDDYSLCMSLANEFIVCNRLKNKEGCHYVKQICLQDIGVSFGDSPLIIVDNDKLPEDSIAYMYVVASGAANDSGFVYGKKCESSKCAEYIRNDFATDVFRGKNKLSNIKSQLADLVVIHSKMVKRRSVDTKTDKV